MNVIKSIVELSHAEYLRKTEHEAYIIHTIQKIKTIEMSKRIEEDEQPVLNIPIITKKITFTAEEIAFIVKILQENINFAPEENTRSEIYNTTSIVQKLVN